MNHRNFITPSGALLNITFLITACCSLSSLPVMGHTDLRLVNVPEDSTVYCGQTSYLPPVSAETFCVDQTNDPDLVRYYNFDDESLITDGSASGFDGVSYGAIWVESGKVGGAYWFSGTNSYIEASDSGLPTGDTARTISMWISNDELHTDGGSDFISYGTQSINQYNYLAIDWRVGRSQFAFSQWGAVVLANPKVTSVSNWIHIAHVYEGNNVHRWFVNGVENTGLRETYGPLNTQLSGILRIGAQTFGQHPFRGMIDEVRIYRRALVPGEVSGIYHGTEAVPVSLAETTNGVCPATITRIWTADDECGGTVSATQTVYVVEPPPLSFVGVPSSTTSSCSEVQSASLVTVEGGCLTETSTDGLIVRYSFDDPTQPGLDSSGNGHHATLNGQNITTNGVMGGACEFTGGGLMKSDTIPEIAGSTQITFGAWIKPGAASGLLGVMGKTIAGNESFYLSLDASIAKLRGYVVPQNREEERIAEAVGTLIPSSWNHVISTYDGRRICLYVNGELVADHISEIPKGIRTNQIDLAIGDVAPNRGWRFKGRMDEVVIYNRVLTAGEVKALAGSQLDQLVEYSETTNGVCPKVIERVWTAEDGCGNTIAATQSITLVDSSSPDLIGIPNDTPINCGVTLLPAQVSAWDDCSGEIPVFLTAETNGVCPATITRIWSATDDCGNTTSATQTVLVLEGSALQLVGVPADTEANCGSIPDAEVSASGVCWSNNAAASPDLVLYYPFNSDGAILDASGAGHIGQPIGAQWTPQGRFGGGYRFQGSNDHIISTDAGLPAGDSPRTVMMWLSVDNLYNDGGTDFISYGTQLQNKFNYLAIDWRIGRKQFAFSQWGAVVLSTQRVTTVSNWIHIAHVYSGSNQHRWYVNGVENTGVKETYGPLNTTLSGTLRLGAQLFGMQKFRGSMDEVRIYQKALTTPEIAEVMVQQGSGYITLTQTTTGTCPPVVRRVWTAEDSCGNTVSATQTITLLDTEAPQLLNVPTNTVMVCDNLSAPASVTAMDQCIGTVPVIYSAITNGQCPGTITRTWTATDGCGNTSVATQSIQVVEAGALQLVGIPGNITIACDEVAPAPVVNVVGGCSVTNQPIDQGLAFYLPFNEEDPLADKSANHHNGTAFGSGYWTNTGKIGGAYRFVGTNDYIATTDAGLSTGDQARTIAMWISVDQLQTTDGTDFISYGTQTNNKYAYLAIDWRFNRKQFAFSQWGAVVLSTQRVTVASNWMHIAYVYEGTNRHRWFVNGNENNGTKETSGALNTVLSGLLRIGGQSFSTHKFKGMMDELRIYTRALTPAEVVQLYNQTNYIPPSVSANSITLNETTNGTCPAIVTRVWTGEDSCGNSVAATQIITRIDTHSPILHGVPLNGAAYCGSIPPAAFVFATDNCSTNIEVDFAETISTNACPGILTRTWSASDNCGNATSAVQFILIEEDNRDTDGDNLLNQVEIQIGTNPEDSDSDNDGLSDWEEYTGLDDSDTNCNPQGNITNPLKPDTDGDGTDDCEESYVGTDPNQDDDGLILNASVEKIRNEIIVCWPSVSNRFYSIVTKTDLSNPVFPLSLATNIPASPPTNCYSMPVQESFHMFIGVKIEKPTAP